MTNSQNFIHLHLHTVFSILNATCSPDELARVASLLGMESVAITDHGTLQGVPAFVEAMHKRGVRPIVGYEAYVWDPNVFPALRDETTRLHHLVLLCENRQGYDNLRILSESATPGGRHGVPCVEKETLRANARGLIALSACLEGEIPSLLLAGMEEEAVRVASQYQEIFGKGSFYLELQNHGLGEQLQVLCGLVDIHDETGIPLVATNDVHFIHWEDHVAHKKLVAKQKDILLENLRDSGWRDPGPQRYFKSGADMGRLFGMDFPQALANTLEISNRCRFVPCSFSPPLSKGGRGDFP